MTGIRAPGRSPRRSSIVPEHRPNPINVQAALKYAPWVLLVLALEIAVLVVR